MRNSPDFSLEGFVKREQHDIECVYRLMYRILFEKARKITRDPNAAEDIVQNLFVRLCETPLPEGTEFESVSKLEYYLLACIYYASISYVHKRRNSRRSRSEFARLCPPEGHVVNFSPAEHQLIKMEVIKHFYDIIETLPPKCKKVFKLIKFEQMRRYEVAAKLDISVRTVDSHLARAIEIIAEKAKRLSLDSYFG
jgi:RNA polymerase sigma-70 factor, ECF subfamily